ncbi:Trm112 family protein [Streptomyces sp. NPDC101227]|uniref:Trm112 family protein n=1 Tax=Streptomyces sp. NPDC101227 TaxID=3366136 RepID=UPI0037FF0AA0
MKPDDPLLKILACPLDKGPLSLLAPDDALYNPRLRRRYPILDGIPQLLPSSGEQVSDAEHNRILGRLTRAAPEAPDGGPAPAPPAPPASDAESTS